MIEAGIPTSERNLVSLAGLSAATAGKYTLNC